MRSEVRVTPAMTVLTLHGDLDMATVDELRQLLDEAVATSSPAIVVELGDVTFVDLVSLSSILAAADLAREDGRTLTVTGASMAVRRLCALLNADDVLSAPVPVPRVSRG
jgi:anti-anti-sigma factor